MEQTWVSTPGNVPLCFPAPCHLGVIAVEAKKSKQNRNIIMCLTGSSRSPARLLLPAQGSWKPLQNPFVLARIGEPAQASAGASQGVQQELSLLGGSWNQLCLWQRRGMLRSRCHGGPREKEFFISGHPPCFTGPPPCVLLTPLLVLPGWGGKHVRKIETSLFCFELCLRCGGEREKQILSSFSYSQFPFLGRRGAVPGLPGGSRAARGSLTPGCGTACSSLFTVGL